MNVLRLNDAELSDVQEALNSRAASAFALADKRELEGNDEGAAALRARGNRLLRLLALTVKGE